VKRFSALVPSLLYVAVFLLPHAAAAQNATEANLTLEGLLSAQPANDSYIGNPYLDRGLSGVRPGVLAGFNLVTPHRMVVSVEHSTTIPIEVVQEGRLVGGGTARSQLRDGLTYVLAGYSKQVSSKARFNVLAGISLGNGVPRVNGIPVNRPYGAGQVDPAAVEGESPLGFSAGVDMVRLGNGRVGAITSFRYSLLARSRRATELGVGDHVLRFGVGIQLDLTSRP